MVFTLVGVNGNPMAGVSQTPSAATVASNGTTSAKLTILSSVAPDTYGINATYTDTNGNQSPTQLVMFSQDVPVSVAVNPIDTATQVALVSAANSGVTVTASVASLNPPGSAPPNQGAVTLTLFDSSGNMLDRKMVNVNNGSTENVTLGSNLANGSYTVSAIYADDTEDYVTSTAASLSVMVGSVPLPPAPPLAAPPTSFELFLDGTTLSLYLELPNPLAIIFADTALIADITAAPGGLLNSYLDLGFLFVYNAFNHGR